MEIMIVVSVISLLAAIAVPSFVRASTSSNKSACINNLLHIQDAMAQWALENRKPSGSPVAYSDIRDYLRNATVCPAGGTSFNDSYTITVVTNLPVCQRVPAGPDAHKLLPDTAQ